MIAWLAGNLIETSTEDFRFLPFLFRYIICSRLVPERKKNQNSTSLKHTVLEQTELRLLGDNKDVKS